LRHDCLDPPSIPAPTAHVLRVATTCEPHFRSNSRCLTSQVKRLGGRGRYASGHGNAAQAVSRVALIACGAGTPRQDSKVRQRLFSPAAGSARRRRKRGSPDRPCTLAPRCGDGPSSQRRRFTPTPNTVAACSARGATESSPSTPRSTRIPREPIGTFCHLTGGRHARHRREPA
jgi:hypothetical protein